MFTAVVVMSCDAVEKSAERLATTCCILQGGINDLKMREELLYLRNYVEHLKPTFSAAGFYRVNQYTLAGIFSVLLTYTIICIQFNT